MPWPIVMVSGWSLPVASLEPLAQRLPWPVHRLSPSPTLPDALPEKFIGIGHSLGGLWLLRHYAPHLAGYASLCGFTRFPWPARVLARMRVRLRENPARVMMDFQSKMGCPALLASLDSPTTLDMQLGWLAEWDVTGTLESLTVPTLSLAGERDTIVPAAPDSVRHPDAGHALPLTYPDWCAERLIPWLQQC